MWLWDVGCHPIFFSILVPNIYILGLNVVGGKEWMARGRAKHIIDK